MSDRKKVEFVAVNEKSDLFRKLLRMAARDFIQYKYEHMSVEQRAGLKFTGQAVLEYVIRPGIEAGNIYSSLRECCDKSMKAKLGGLCSSEAEKADLMFTAFAVDMRAKRAAKKGSAAPPVEPPPPSKADRFKKLGIKKRVFASTPTPASSLASPASSLASPPAASSSSASSSSSPPASSSSSSSKSSSSSSAAAPASKKRPPPTVTTGKGGEGAKKRLKKPVPDIAPPRKKKKQEVPAGLRLLGKIPKRSVSPASAFLAKLSSSSW